MLVRPQPLDPFDSTPGGHRRFNVHGAIAAIASAMAKVPGEPVPSEVPDVVSSEVPYVWVAPEYSVVVTCDATISP